ncbi:DUF4231 domain-containing protein, partial [Vibrio anguillarum]|nr:DUF4231 domain-containing protein [Vibrio anguillarum]MBF4317701.1 DUF4231 domain-containing protein [Vibrio anguillarum]
MSEPKDFCVDSVDSYALAQAKHYQ